MILSLQKYILWIRVKMCIRKNDGERGGSFAAPEKSQLIFCVVGKQTLRVSVLKFLRVTEMPHTYAKYKYGFKAIDSSTKVCALKKPNTFWIKLSHRKQKLKVGSCMTQVRVK